MSMLLHQDLLALCAGGFGGSYGFGGGGGDGGFFGDFAAGADWGGTDFGVSFDFGPPADAAPSDAAPSDAGPSDASGETSNEGADGGPGEAPGGGESGPFNFGNTGGGQGEGTGNGDPGGDATPKPVYDPPLTPQEEYDLAVDAAQNTPLTDLNQGQQPDCSVVATERGLDPAYLDQIVKPVGDGFYEVTLLGPDGQAQIQTVWLHPGEVFGTGDPRAMAAEKALVYNAQGAAGIEGYNGVRVDQAMTQLGLQSPQWGPVDAALANNPNSVVVLQTGADVGPMPYGLVANHAYTAVGTAMSPDGTLMVLVSNPWGFGQPLPIPADALGTAFVGATTGQMWPDP